jgi:hypothetical protein
MSSVDVGDKVRVSSNKSSKISNNSNTQFNTTKMERDPISQFADDLGWGISEYFFGVKEGDPSDLSRSDFKRWCKSWIYSCKCIITRRRCSSNTRRYNFSERYHRLRNG